MAYRIYIEKFNAGDFDAYYSLVSNLEVMAMITERAITLDEAKKDYNHLLENNDVHDVFGNFKVYEYSSNHFIGLAKLEVKAKYDHEAELGYMILPEFWGMGYGKEIASFMLDKASKQPTLKKVSAVIDPKNTASKKILLNHNFTTEKVGEIEGLPGEILSKVL
ncbi:GNAT family N-acetyltransferase [Olivibacter sp. SDN3]|uniref:GNAT family N-acetyltransferase n=1 Tax=Olivibacter sp. SDN3 TaxID=2764720 RepID=UPI001651AE90|nr:GNAT family N-acetyltransferase [Olivibacter sp. SDN3]QNL49407.1 GNAT family N-acetyltransferase [Olivibacter sp. SDN3]